MARGKKGAVKRKASAPLQVMLEPERLERYRAVAEEMKLSMRDFVVLAVDDFISRHHVRISDFDQVIAQNFSRSVDKRTIGPDGDVLVGWAPDPPDVSSVLRLVVALSNRVSELENGVEQLNFQVRAHDRRLEAHGIRDA